MLFADHILCLYNSSHPSLLYLADKPDDIQFTAPTLKPQDGDAVTLTCTSNGVPTPTYRIYKITGSSSTLVASGNSYQIARINYADYTGYKVAFRCESKNSFGNFTKDIQLDIQGKIFDYCNQACIFFHSLL